MLQPPACDADAGIRGPAHGARFYMTNKRLVLTAASSPEESKKIARALVESRLAACVNIIPKIESVYRWEGKVEEAHEYLLLIKTTQEAFPRLREMIQQLHSYDVPECIALSVEEGSQAYLNWIDASVS
jgi:periplasmic divalent cation tolerance protein